MRTMKSFVIFFVGHQTFIIDKRHNCRWLQGKNILHIFTHAYNTHKHIHKIHTLPKDLITLRKYLHRKIELLTNLQQYQFAV